MQPLIRQQVDGGVAVVAHSTRTDGDLSPSGVAVDDLEQRRQAAVPRPWCAVHQVHSDRVVVADVASSRANRPVADALVTTGSGVALAVHSGDCVPIGFISAAGVIGAAHAGWKGLEAGVLESTVRSLRLTARSNDVVAAVGPHIRKDRYEFAAPDLQRLTSRFGADVASTTQAGRPAFDLTAAVGNELDRLGVTVLHWSPDCTAGDADRYWSHRARQEAGRIALVAWIEPTPHG